MQVKVIKLFAQLDKHKAEVIYTSIKVAIYCICQQRKNFLINIGFCWNFK